MCAESVPAVRERWSEWPGAAGRRNLKTRCPVLSYAAREQHRGPVGLVQVNFRVGYNNTALSHSRGYILIL